MFQSNMSKSKPVPIVLLVVYTICTSLSFERIYLYELQAHSKL